MTKNNEIEKILDKNTESKKEKKVERDIKDYKEEELLEKMNNYLDPFLKNTDSVSKLILFEEFAIREFNCTANQLKMQVKKFDKVNEKWNIYKELMKLKFSKDPKHPKFYEQLMIDYDLDVADKTLPDINITFGDNEDIKIEREELIKISQVRKDELEFQKALLNKQMSEKDEEQEILNEIEGAGN